MRGELVRAMCLAIGVSIFGATASAAAAARDSRGAIEPFAVQASAGDVLVVDVDLASIGEAVSSHRPTTVRGFPLTATERVDLELERFFVTGPNTRFVVGSKGGPDRVASFDPSRITLLRGSVSGVPGSHVYMALRDMADGTGGDARSTVVTGHVDLGAGRGRYLISSKGALGEPLGGGRMSVFRARAGGSRTPDVPLCGVGPDGPLTLGELLPAEATGRDARPTVVGGDARATVSGGDARATVVGGDARSTDAYTDTVQGGGAPRVASGVPFRRGLKHMELAVETDFEYFQLFGDEDEAFAYLVEMYGAVSDIYMRDVDARVELVFGRIWTDPDDMFNDVDPSPLPEFRDFWNQNMGHVHRDVAQLLSGRRDYPFGGQAHLNGLCNSRGYSVVGYALGFFPDPAWPDPYHYDIYVTAHELGHTAGTGHTQDNGIDECHNPNTIPQRGTIMSYCSQTWSGQNMNGDLYFHAVIQANIDEHIAESACIVADCNANSIDDAEDIQQGTSDDVNTNGVPDECEDCNENDVLDDEDIRSGHSADLNGNQIPDECEPDCNGNDIPDDKDIADGTSDDAYGNDIPDECETDCDDNGVSDYTDIQRNMPLDVDRDTLLDSCQDCDNDGTIDLLDIEESHFLWVASGLENQPLRQFHAASGVRTRISSGGQGSAVNAGQDVVVTTGGRVFVSSATDDRVMEFTVTGAYVGDFVASGVGGLDHPTGMVIAGDVLLVASRETDNVLAYALADGAVLGAFVTAGSGGLDAPFGMTFGPEGDLYVTSATNEVMRYDGVDGSFIEVFVVAQDNGGLDDPRGLSFIPNGNLLVASFQTNETLAYDGDTGAALGKWAQVGTPNVLTQESPWGIRVARNGNVFVVRTGEDFGDASPDGGGHLHLTNAQIYEFDGRSGWFLRTHIGGHDHGLEFPTGFFIIPDQGTDCNANQLPDNCDIASGGSEDADENGVPDECEIDCNENGTFDQFDIIPAGASRDCNANRVPDECDVASGFSEDLNENGRPDECDPDCNFNGVPDDLDIERGESDDCNDDGTPDECQLIGNDCDANGVPDDCDPDCDEDGIPNDCDFEPVFTDNFENDTGWTAVNLGAESGDWERGVPVNDPDWDFDPISDSDGSGQCYLTENQLGNTDVDGGAVRLISPLLDMSIGSMAIRYDYFLRLTEPGPDRLLVEINSDDGNGAWIEIARHETNGGLSWRSHQVTPVELEERGVEMTDRMRIRFTVNDANPQSIVESALDAFELASLGADCNENDVPDDCDIDNGTSDDENGNGIPDECELGACCTGDTCENTMRDECVGGGCVRDPAWMCDGDVDGDGQVNPVDSGLVQAAFGTTDDQDLCNYDMDCDGQINPVDSGIVQSLFGTCDAPRAECTGAGEWFVGEDCAAFECP